MKKGLFLDLDDTIISGSSEKAFLSYLYQLKKISKREMLAIFCLFIRHKLYLITDYKEAKKKTVRWLLKNKNYQELIDSFEGFFNTTLVKKIYNEIYAIIESHKEQKHEIYIISASLDFIVEKFRLHLGAKDYFAIQTERENGMFTGEIVGSVMFSEEKAKIIKKICEEEGIDLINSYAYSDSFLDIPMLSVVGNPVAANPDQKLLQYAKQNGWEIVKWARVQ